MSRRLKAAAIATLLLSAPLPVLAAAKCNTPAEIGSMQYRQLQIEMMVASLKCGGGDYDYRAHYGAYMRKVGSGLSRNANELRAMFVRQGKGRAYLDRYLTGMSNDAQMRSAYIPDYCGKAATVMDRLAALPPGEIPKFAAETIGNPYGAKACAARPHAAAPKKKKAIKKAARKAATEG